MASPLRLGLLLGLAIGSTVLAYEGDVRRQEVDGGVHQPQLTKAPELKAFVSAVYPPQAEAEGLTASVRLLVTIGDDGRVLDAIVPEPVGHGFDEAAIAAVKQFSFSPAEVDGVPAAIQIEYVYHFVLEEKPKEAQAEAPPPKAVLEGQLITRGSRNRIPGATVRCGDSPDAPEATTDAEGRFKLETTPGSCEVRAVASGHQLFKTEEALEPGERREVVYHLIPQAIGFETVVRGAREKKEVVRRTLDRQELQKVPGTFGDPVRVLQNLPGVARAPFISGQLIVRGARADQTSTLFDGVEIPLLYHLGGGPSIVNAEFLDRIDFYPGGFGARYGRAVGGVVDVATRKGSSDTWHGSAKVDLLDAGFFLESPVAPGVSIAAAARRSYIDVLLPLVLPNDPRGGSLLVLPRYWDYQVRADFGAKRDEQGPKSPHSFYVMAFGSDDVLNVVATGGGRNRDVTVDVQTLFHRLKGDWTYRQGNVTSTFTPYVGYDLASLGFGVAKLDSDIYTLGAREDFAVELSSMFTARAGFDLIFRHLKGRAELPVLSGVQYVAFPGAEPKAELQELTRSVNSFDGAVFAEADVKLGPVTVTPGVRHSQMRLYGHHRAATDPRLWVRYTMSEATALKGSVGHYTQAPDATQLEPAPLGNPDLLTEKAFQASLGFEQRLTDNLNVDVTGYYNRRYDNVVSPGGTTVNEDGSVTRLQYSNDGLGRAYGVELMLRHEITRDFFGWVAYTFNRSEQRRRGEEEYVLTQNDQTHLLTLVASYRFPGGYELGTRFRYVTGRPTTPLQHAFDIFGSDANRYYGTRGDPFSTRLEPFHQLDVRLDKSWLFRDWTLTAYLDVQNVYNAQNTEAFFNDYRFREEIPVPGIPILPVIGVKGSF